MPQTPMVEPMSAARHALSVRDLVVDFVQDTGAVRALDGVSLDLHAGRVLGVVGESGCGKSVTARAILRLIDRPGRIASGRVLLDPGTPEQQDLAALDPEGKAMRAVRGGRIGLIFQEPMTALSVHYTVGNQIIEAMRAHSDISKAEARQRVVALLHEVGIPRPETRIDAYPFQLSRRPAPARRHCAGVGRRSANPDRGRADHRARRHDAGADPGAAAPAATDKRRGADADHP